MDDELCTTFRCKLIPAHVVGEVLACGLPFVLSLWVARYILQKNSYRLDRTRFISEWSFAENSRDPFSYEERLPCLTKLVKVAVVSPLLFGTFWAAMSWYLLESYYAHPRFPRAVAGALAACSLSFCLGAYGFMHWATSRFRMTYTTGICFGLVGAIMLALQLSFTFFVLDTARSAFIVFIGFNLAPLMLSFYLPRIIAMPLDFQQMLRLSSSKQDEAQFHEECERVKHLSRKAQTWLFIASLVPLAIFGVVMQASFQSAFGWQVALAILFCDFACSIHNSSGLASDPLLLHTLGLAARAILFICWSDLWFAAVSLNFLLFVAFFIYHTIDRRYPLFTKEDALDSVVGSIESAMDEERMRETKVKRKEAERQARIAAAQAAEQEEKTGFAAVQSELESGFDHALDRMRSIVPGAAREKVEEFHAQAEAFAEEALAWFRTPEFALGILSFFYLLYVAFALYADRANPSWADKLFPEIVLSRSSTSRPHPQWQVGLVTSLILVSATLFFLAYRCYEINAFHLNGRVVGNGFAFLLVSIASSVGTALVTESSIILVFGIYGPLIAVVATLTYCNWRRQDYRWNGWAEFQRNAWKQQMRDKREAAQKGDKKLVERPSVAEQPTDLTSVRLEPVSSEGAGSVQTRPSAKSQSASLGHRLFRRFAGRVHFGHQFALIRHEYTCEHEWDDDPVKHPKFLILMITDFLRFRHAWPDYIIAVSVALLAGLCSGIGVTLAHYEDPEYSYFVASMIGVVIFTIFLLLKYFNTFKLGYIQLLVLTGLLTHCSIELDRTGHLPDYSVAAFALLYPAVLAFIMAIYNWKMNGWKISKMVKSVLAVSSTLVLVTIIQFMAQSHMYAEGGIMLLAFVVATSFLILIMVWSDNDFHLPPFYFKAAVAGSCILVLGALIVILALNKTWFQMFTVLWVFALIGLASYTIKETRQSETRKLLPAKYIFPVFEYQPKLNEITIAVRNNGIIALICFAALLMVWGFIAGLLLHPPWVGWTFFCGGGLTLWLITLEALFKPIMEFWPNFIILAASPKLIDHARETALASQMGAEEAAFDEMGDDSAAGGGGLAAFADGFEGAGNGTLANEDDAQRTLQRLQLYWRLEGRSAVEELQQQRDAYIAHPTAPTDLDVGARARFIEDTIAQFDERLGQVFDEQMRTVVMFQLLVNMGAQALKKKNRARVKDFLRQYFAKRVELADRRAEAEAEGREIPADAIDDDASPLIDLSSANAVEIKEWAESNKHLREKVYEYIHQAAGSAENLKKSLEEQRAAAAERTKIAHTIDPNQPRQSMSAQVVPMRPSATQPQQPQQLQIVVEAAGGEDESKTASSTVTAITSSASSSSSPSFTPDLSSQQLLVDSFQYCQRGLSFDLNELHIRGSTSKEVVEKARVAVEKIIQQHTRDAKSMDGAQRFCDPTFPVVHNLDQLIDAGTDPADKPPPGSGKKASSCWKRPRDICHDPKVFAEGRLDPSQIIQGDLETCYLLSALSVLTNREDRMQSLMNLFLVKEYNEYGIYGMTFFVDGEWRAVFIDDQFPYQNDRLAFAHSKNPNEFWLPIVEKCYAKLYAGYPSIIGGLVHASFKDLTGGITDEVALDSADSGAFDGRLWARLYSYFKQDYLLGCGNPKPSAGNFEMVNGIVQGHAYALLDMREIGDIKLIKLRNPWGEGEWEGDWGDNSDKWTQKMRQLCDYTDSDENDGVFWMSFEDFAVNFQRVYICRVFDHIIELDDPTRHAARSVALSVSGKKLIPPAAQPGGLGAVAWHKNSLTGEWSGASAAGHLCWIRKYPERRVELNPQYTLKLTGSRPSIVFITLTQPTQTGGGDYLYLSLLVLNKNGRRAREVKKSEIVGGNTKCRNTRELCAEVTLQADTTYTIFVATYEPDQCSKFTLSAYCRYPIELTPLPEDAPVS